MSDDEKPFQPTAQQVADFRSHMWEPQPSEAKPPSGAMYRKNSDQASILIPRALHQTLKELAVSKRLGLAALIALALNDYVRRDRQRQIDNEDGDRRLANFEAEQRDREAARRQTVGASEKE